MKEVQNNGESLNRQRGSVWIEVALGDISRRNKASKTIEIDSD